METSFTCLECGAAIHPNSRACRECGADLASAHPREIDLPDEDFDYDGFVKQEFGGAGKFKPRGISVFWWVTAVLLLLAFALLSIGIL